jgi:hypothetical protein
MGGKITGVMVALAISSTSSLIAAVYTGALTIRHDNGGVFHLLGGSGRGPLGVGIVHDTAKDALTSSDLPVGDDICRSVVGPGECYLVFSSDELRLTFFGYTVSLPTDWYSNLSGDDIYQIGAAGRFLEAFEVRGVSLIRKKAEDSNIHFEFSSHSYNGNVLPDDIATPFTNLIVATDYSNLNVVADYTIGNFQRPVIPNGSSNPVEVEGSPIPFLAMSPSASVPEPATWAMMVLGFAGLSFAGYRRTRKGRERGSLAQAVRKRPRWRQHGRLAPTLRRGEPGLSENDRLFRGRTL